MTPPWVATPQVGDGTSPANFREATAEQRIQAVPLAHFSVELGHLYAEELAAGAGALRQRFQQVAPWASAAQEICEASLPPGKRPRMSTCFLVDDYSAPVGPPATVVPDLVQAARDCGLEIDYLARESGCVIAGGVELAQLVEERIVPDPPPDTTGLRPLFTETGWVCNGQRSPGTLAVQAMEPPAGWRPPVQSAARRHSVFVDVELWDEPGGKRTWSCAFLAAVWQLLRLGLLRNHGRSVAVPQPWPGDLPGRWDELPAVVQLNSRAAPFSAYRSLSILSNRFLATEHAVRTILSQVAPETAVASQVVDRAWGEDIVLPPEAVDRIEYVFAAAPAVADPARGTPAPSPRAAGTAAPGT